MIQGASDTTMCRGMHVLALLAGTGSEMAYRETRMVLRCLPAQEKGTGYLKICFILWQDLAFVFGLRRYR